MADTAPSAPPTERPDPELEAARQEFAHRRIIIQFGDGRRASCIAAEVFRGAQGVRVRVLFPPATLRVFDADFLRANARIPTAHPGGGAR